ncbi:MAG: hypothetical protein HRU33_21065 [Rhodobacteraceae bacterium]|nr:hypothetical protein [Paracoccaceae bacterium]
MTEDNGFRLYRWRTDPSLIEQLIERRFSAPEDATEDISVGGWQLDPHAHAEDIENLKAAVDEVVRDAKCAEDLSGALIEIVRMALAEGDRESN